MADAKDVDGFGTNNIGELAKRTGNPTLMPCTPKGVMVLLRESGVDTTELKERFPMTIKKKTHAVYGAFYKEPGEEVKATKLRFD